MNAGDTAWLLVSTALVLLMTVGLAFFYGGLVRKDQTVNALVMSFIALGIIAVTWALFGYSLAFSPGSPYIGGLDWWALRGIGIEPSAVYADTVPHLLFVAFQMTFAIITPALISGAVVGRMKFKAYMVFIVLWSLIVYVPLARWVWADGGWLGTLGVLDFAGGTVVHISAGVSALVAAYMIGPRSEKVELGGGAYADLSNGKPHNVSLTVLGAGLLWFGWFGFNAGSALKADGTAALAFINTFLAASAAVVTWTWRDAARHKQISAVGVSIGAVIGLVAITPAAGYVQPGGAIFIGFLATWICHTVLTFKTRVDDTLDVFACHGVGGIIGALLTGVYAPEGSIALQALGVLVGASWAAAGTAGLLFLLKKVMVVRLSPEEEVKGIDDIEHGERAYDL